MDLSASELFKQREQATRELKEFAEDAEFLLRGVLAREASAEVRRRIELILQGMQGEPPSAETLQVMRAVETLERAATAESKRALQRVSDGPAEARVTREAKAALERLGRRPGK